MVTEEEVKIIGQGINFLLQEVDRRERIAPEVNLASAVVDVDSGKRLP
jgi:hypothetical protein